MTNPSRPRKRFPRLRKALGWIFFLPAGSIVLSLPGVLTAVLGGKNFVVETMLYAVAVGASMYVAQRICPAPRFGMSVFAFFSLSSLVGVVELGFVKVLLSFVAWLSGVALAVRFAAPQLPQRAKIRALRWTLFVPIAYFVSAIVWVFLIFLSLRASPSSSGWQSRPSLSPEA